MGVFPFRVSLAARDQESQTARAPFRPWDGDQCWDLVTDWKRRGEILQLTPFSLAWCFTFINAWNRWMLKGVYNKSDGYQIMSYSQYRRLFIIVELSTIRTFLVGHFVHHDNKRVFHQNLWAYRNSKLFLSGFRAARLDTDAAQDYGASRAAISRLVAIVFAEFRLLLRILHVGRARAKHFPLTLDLF